ncbi:MAG: hypothetical protein CM15mP125_1230 [Gammaproteobacteria bacterium]|nr:MAG: hypothetical protein CM15mP125_1230 [Gammaproteobacteria bacterium]
MSTLANLVRPCDRWDQVIDLTETLERTIQ